MCQKKKQINTDHHKTFCFFYPDLATKPLLTFAQVSTHIADETQLASSILMFMNHNSIFHRSLGVESEIHQAVVQCVVLMALHGNRFLTKTAWSSCWRESMESSRGNDWMHVTDVPFSYLGF